MGPSCDGVLPVQGGRGCLLFIDTILLPPCKSMLPVSIAAWAPVDGECKGQAERFRPVMRGSEKAPMHIQYIPQ